MYSFWLDETATPAKRYYEGRAFVYGEGDDKVQYTKAGATPATFASLKFKEVIIDPRPWDDNFYIVSGPDNDGHYNATPRDHIQMVGSYVQQEAETCKSLLAQTDWMVIRKMETGTEIPPEWAKHREDCRNVCGLRQQAEMETKDTLELEALVKAPAEIYDEQAKTFSENPQKHLTPWPVDPVTQAQMNKPAVAPLPTQPDEFFTKMVEGASRAQLQKLIDEKLPGQDFSQFKQLPVLREAVALDLTIALAQNGKV